MSGRLARIGCVLRKELTDALRDRRTLLTVFLSSVLMGPLLLVVISNITASFEARAELREVYVSGLDRAPTLRNFLERQTYTVKPAPEGFEAALRKGSFSDPVVVVGEGFERDLARGDAPIVEIVSDSGNQRAEAGSARLARLLGAFSQERVVLNLAMRGVAVQLLEPVQVEERDLANAQTRAARLTGMLPFFVMMAVLYGALTASLDTTAGERERGSLEPLLMTPAERWAIVVGKWGAVATLGMLIAFLSSVSFLPGQWLLRSDTLAAMFRYGWVEATLFLVVLAPFAAALSALLMAVAIRCKTFKEAQASATVLVLAVSLLPLVSVFDFGGESPWHIWVPALAQNVLMSRVLKGEAIGAVDVLVPFAVCALLSVLGIAYVARTLRQAALK